MDCEGAEIDILEAQQSPEDWRNVRRLVFEYRLRPFHRGEGREIWHSEGKRRISDRGVPGDERSSDSVARSYRVLHSFTKRRDMTRFRALAQRLRRLGLLMQPNAWNGNAWPRARDRNHHSVTSRSLYSTFPRIGMEDAALAAVEDPAVLEWPWHFDALIFCARD
jgi:hypothetical protein